MKYIILLCVFAPLLSSCQDSNSFRELHDEPNNHLDRVRRQQPQQNNYHQPQPNYRPLSQAPANIQQLLHLQQAREPLVNVPAQPQPNLHTAPQQAPVQSNQGQGGAYQPQVQYGQAPQQPNYQNHAAASANQYRPQQPQGPPQQYQG